MRQGLLNKWLAAFVFVFMFFFPSVSLGQNGKTSGVHVAGVFDKRPPEIQRAQGIIEGTAANTLPTLLRKTDQLLINAERIPVVQFMASKMASKIENLVKCLEELRAQLDKLLPRSAETASIHVRLSMAKDEDYTKTTSDPEIIKLLMLANLAGNYMSCLINSIDNLNHDCGKLEP